MYEKYRVRYTQNKRRLEKIFNNIFDAAEFWADQDDTAVVLDEYDAIVEYDDLLRFL